MIYSLRDYLGNKNKRTAKIVGILFILATVAGAINEMVLAVWLIVKGLNVPANEPEPSIVA